MHPLRKALHTPFHDPLAASSHAPEAAQTVHSERPSKSQRKRDMHALLNLGKELVALPDDKLKRLPLSESLYEAIRLAQRITSREGKRRQIHYVGKLMRQAPAQEIQAQLLAFKHGVRSASTSSKRSSNTVSNTPPFPKSPKTSS